MPPSQNPLSTLVMAGSLVQQLVTDGLPPFGLARHPYGWQGAQLDTIERQARAAQTNIQLTGREFSFMAVSFQQVRRLIWLRRPRADGLHLRYNRGSFSLSTFFELTPLSYSVAQQIF
jgi:hypothetical protein